MKNQRIDLGLLKEEHLMAEQAGYFYTYSCPERRRRLSASEVEWVMNSSVKKVNFDDYKVIYIRPKVRAIKHYYPNGWLMYGIDQASCLIGLLLVSLLSG